MKKIMYLAAFAAMTLASCSEDITAPGDQNANEPTPVAFGIYANDATKAAIVLPADIDSVGLFAFEQEQATLQTYAKANFLPNFMYNQALVKDAQGDWSYTPIKYWPNNYGAKVSFYAYAPYTKDFNSDAYTQTPETNSYLNEVQANKNGLRLMLGYDWNGPGIEYNVPADPTKGIDLMWGADKTAATACPFDYTKQTISEKIQFQMKHALSRLGFTIQVIVDDVDGSANNEIAANTTVVIKRVSLVGNFASKGTLRLYDGTWNVANGDFQTLEFVKDANQFAAGIEDGLTADEAIDAIPLLKESATGAADNYVMAIPGAKFYIEVEYDVNTVDPDNAKNNSSVNNVIRSTDAHAAVSPALTDGKFELKQGTAYMFNLRLGLNSVKFDVTADDWNSPATEYDVDLPQNEQ